VKLLHVIALVAVILAGGVVHAMSPPSTSSEYQVRITVDTTGHISSMQPEQSLFDDDMQALKQAAPKWRFGVRKVNGVPVPCTTWLRVKFTHTGATHSLEYIGNGPYVELTRIPYPTHLYQWHIAAIFYVHFVVEANGTVDNVRLIQAWTSGGKPIGDAMTDVTKGILRWKAKPMLVDGHPVSTPMIAPVAFFTGNSLDKYDLDYGLRIASDSPNSGQSVTNIPESGTVAPE